MRSSLVPLILGTVFLAGLSPAWANGLTTHAWISQQALEELPGGELAELLRRPELRDPLINGTLFPDGGYAVDHPYGETAHWEPFRLAYMAWIQQEFSPPYTSGEAAQHVAFLMGLSSHGMADEVFDSRFMELSRRYDPGWEHDVAPLDTASDVLLAAAVGGFVAPDLWVPAETLAGLLTAVGTPVDTDTVQEGHSRTFIALEYTEWARSQASLIEDFSAEYPWTAEHIIDAEIPGSPPREAVVVSRFWQAVWERLNDEAFEQAVVHVSPEDGSFGHAISADDVESRLWLSFGRGVDEDTLGEVAVRSTEGADVEVEVDHHYGNFSHSVTVFPQQDWAEDTDYVLEVGTGITDVDGQSPSSAWSSTFSTRAPPPPPAAEEGDCSGCALEGQQGLRAPFAWLFTALVVVCARRRESRSSSSTERDLLGSRDKSLV